jgi:glycosyltransferase involved in cell wall biosynthesis
MSPSFSARRIVAVVPAFNEASKIRRVVDELLAVCPHVVVVDDGSDDDTAERLLGSGAVVLRHRLNRGQGAALQTGITQAVRLGADVVVTFDADGQHDPTDVDKLVAPVLRGECDVTLGSRFLGSSIDMPASRRWLLRLAIVFTQIVSRIRVSDVHNGLRAFSRGAAAELRITLDQMAHATEILELIKLHGWRYKEVPVTIRYTEYSLAKGQRLSDAVRIGVHVLLDKLR